MKVWGVMGMAACAAIVAGCASSFPVGVIHTDVKLPVTATSNSGAATKIGVAECRSYLGLIAMGDASLEAAKRNGGITKVYHVDWAAENVLGFFGKYRLTVYGE